MLQFAKHFTTSLLRSRPQNHAISFFFNPSFHLSKRHPPSHHRIACIPSRKCSTEMDHLPSNSDNKAASSTPAAKQYIGVRYSPDNVKKYSAELELDEYHTINGGDFWTAEDAARGYDELVDLYCDDDTRRNFPPSTSENPIEKSNEFSEWDLPETGERHADLIPIVEATYFTIDEVIHALEREKAMNIHTIDLTGKSSLAKYMVFVTGRSQAHMRRLADMIIRSIKARQIKDDFEYGVEGRDCDDWMIADCNTIVIHFLREETRQILKLEEHWELMENDRHKIYGNMSSEEYIDKFGISEYLEHTESNDIIASEESFDLERKDAAARTRTTDATDTKTKKPIQWK
ncbi:unnamed protein product [Albugo candida]|uniref:Iojap-like ribosome-associated protein n=1 Tax=Albugo candida TaxID=65357 RepID=A0A024GQS7_9STRA|nr:unnamed protein product [Albugo candida]|eukprot:CCI48713.1 unnamed protein product [Albugo candida]